MLQSGSIRTNGDSFHLETKSDSFHLDELDAGNGTVVVAVHGDADLRVASELKDHLSAIIDDGASSLVLDLSTTTFLDSMALGVLLAGMKRLRARGGRFRVVAPSSEIRRIFEITLLDRVFDLDATREQAVLAASGRSF
jgi:anti-sigma B factor antagonist